MHHKLYDHTTRALVAFALAAGLYLSGTTRLVSRTAQDGGGLGGIARVVDGDTLVVGETRIRLEGIDAPEPGQTCGRKMLGHWACGTEASAALSQLVEGKSLRCETHGTDAYSRTLAVCFLDAQDVNAWMVTQGLAWAFVRYSQRYVSHEAQARGRRVGIWQGEATPAWDYRAQRWSKVEGAAPAGCAIKGNVTANGKIYHMPWSPWYGRIVMHPAKGRRWFCTETEALAAGWRPVNMH